MEIIFTKVKQESLHRRLRAYSVLAFAKLLRVDIRLTDKFRDASSLGATSEHNQ